MLEMTIPIYIILILKLLKSLTSIYMPIQASNSKHQTIFYHLNLKYYYNKQRYI